MSLSSDTHDAHSRCPEIVNLFAALSDMPSLAYMQPTDRATAVSTQGLLREAFLIRTVISIGAQETASNARGPSIPIVVTPRFQSSFIRYGSLIAHRFTPPGGSQNSKDYYDSGGVVVKHFQQGSKGCGAPLPQYPNMSQLRTKSTPRSFITTRLISVILQTISRKRLSCERRSDYAANLDVIGLKMQLSSRDCDNVFFRSASWGLASQGARGEEES